MPGPTEVEHRVPDAEPDIRLAQWSTDEIHQVRRRTGLCGIVVQLLGGALHVGGRHRELVWRGHCS
jgi:hypothetical protein